MNNTVIGFPFVSNVDQEKRPKIENATEFIKDKFSGSHQFGLDNLMRYGVFKLLGYKYDFSPFLKKFLYKQYGNWTEAYAPNKTSLRKVVYGRIDKIVEID